MDGVFFALSIVAIVLVMWWVLRNDGVPLDGRTLGLFAMRRVAPGEAGARPDRRAPRRRRGRPQPWDAATWDASPGDPPAPHDLMRD